MSGLTQRQQQLLDLLTNAERTPSFDEMKDALGLKSKSGIHRLISALEERGFIRRLPHRARAIEVIPERTAELDAKSALAQSEAYLKLSRRVGELEWLIQTIWRIEPTVMQRAYQMLAAWGSTA